MDVMPVLGFLPLFLIVAAMYASVGHGGASGYLALFAILGAASARIVPAVLVLNILVAAIGFWQFRRAGYFRPSLLLPFVIASIPAAYVGGMIDIGRETFTLLLGAALLFSAWRIVVFRGADIEAAPPRGGALWLRALPVGAALGFLAGLIGIGGGVFLSPLLLIAGWADTKQTAAVSSAFIVLNSAGGLAGHLHNTGLSAFPQEILPVAPLIAAVLLGGVIGARAGSHILPVRGIRVVLASVLLIAGGKLIGTAVL